MQQCTDKLLMKLVQDLSNLEQVEAILWAGSHGMKQQDEYSDYDLYVYATSEIPIEARKQIYDQYTTYMEVNNQFWETEDDGVLANGMPVEIIFRSIDWLDEILTSIVLRSEAWVGYTTCFWNNLLHSAILYDANGRAEQLQRKFSIPYPRALKHAIVLKNYPLLMKQMPAYYHQIDKALKRGDAVSLNHRVAGYLASYFDIVFAINELPHPGEKRMLSIAMSQCSKQPESMEHRVLQVLAQAGTCDKGILKVIEQMVHSLDRLLEQEGLLP